MPLCRARQRGGSKHLEQGGGKQSRVGGAQGGWAVGSRCKGSLGAIALGGGEGGGGGGGGGATAGVSLH